MKYFFLIVVFFSFQMLFAQNHLRILVKSAEDHQPLVGANVYFDSLQIGASTNAQGIAEIKNIPNGTHTLIISYVGYATQKMPLYFPFKTNEKSFVVFLEAAPYSTDQIVVTSTRNNSILSKTPIRIEVLGKEEVNEEIAIKPGDISKFLGESSSIITRQTSPISGAIRFRLQGLPARYTQILKDGFPDFSGLISGLSPLQIPPLDLQQVEITRGSYATLFANGAIAGIINLISRRPTLKPHWDFILNQTSRKKKDIGAFYTAKFAKAGLTFLVSQSLQSAVDVNHDGFSDIPQFRQATVNPRFFYDFNSTTSLIIGLNSFFENRQGGDMQALTKGKSAQHFYEESYLTKRLGINARFQKQFADSSSLTLKTMAQNFRQTVSFPNSYFNGLQSYLFAEGSYFHPWKKHKWVAGFSLQNRRFKQEKQGFKSLYDYRFTTLSAFVQDDWNVAATWVFHGGLRWDYRWGDRSFLLPNVSLLFNASRNLKLRFSGGVGYSMPVLSDIVPENIYYTYRLTTPLKLHAENSHDVSFDLTYHYVMHDWAFSLNQAFYATRVDAAQFFRKDLTLFSSPILAQGSETHLLINADALEFFIDYNYVDTRRILTSRHKILPYTPKHKLNVTVTYEKEGRWKTGVESFYTGNQYLQDGKRVRSYFIFGLMFEKIFKKCSLIFNIENVLDERQSKFEKMVELKNGSPQFKEIYMPIDGRVMNLAVWVKF